MARTVKKEKALTLEEKLAQALVPDVEKPYRVPENWCWTRIYACCEDMFSGKSPKYSKEQTEYPIIGQQANQRYGIDLQYVKYGTEEFALTQEKRFFLHYNDVLLNTLGTGSIGRSGIYKSNERILTDGHPFVFRTGARYISDLFYYYLQVNEEQIINTANGSTNQKFLSLKSFSQFPIPLPPLAEQQRIVDRIESLFAKLDEAKEKAQAVIDGYEDRRAAILHRAFVGELTKEWRRDNSISKENWKLLGFDDCVDVMQNGIAKRKGDTGEPYVVLRLANLSDDEFDGTDLREIVLDEKEQKNYELHSDDVLMVRVNGSKDNVGKQYRITNQKRWAFCDHIIRIRYKNSIVPQYMVYFSKSETYRQYIKDNMVSSAGQNTISRKGMSRLRIPMPQKNEQEQIVSILSKLFEKEQQVKEAAERVIDQIDSMKKSILARAFRGELGTNDPTDEPALELLKKIIKG